MPRTYIVQSWLDAAADYDQGDTYSGEQIGNRNQKSIGVHIIRSGDQWKANIAAYADAPKSKAKQKSAFERVALADRHYSRLEQLSQELDAELENGLLSIEDWNYARKQLDKRLDAGWLRLCKERGWDPDERDEEISSQSKKKGVESKNEQAVSFTKDLINSLSDENCLKIPLKKLLTVKEKLSKIINIIKQ